MVARMVGVRADSRVRAAGARSDWEAVVKIKVAETEMIVLLGVFETTSVLLGVLNAMKNLKETKAEIIMILEEVTLTIHTNSYD